MRYSALSSAITRVSIRACHSQIGKVKGRSEAPKTNPEFGEELTFSDAIHTLKLRWSIDNCFLISELVAEFEGLNDTNLAGVGS